MLWLPSCSFSLAMLALGVARSNAKKPSRETCVVRNSDALVGQRGTQPLAKSHMKDAVLEVNPWFPLWQISIAAQVWWFLYVSFLQPRPTRKDNFKWGIDEVVMWACLGGAVLITIDPSPLFYLGRSQPGCYHPIGWTLNSVRVKKAEE